MLRMGAVRSTWSVANTVAPSGASNAVPLVAVDADGTVTAAWQSDTLQSDDADEARRVLRALVVRLGELAEQGAADPADAVAPFVEALLAVRTGARENKDFATSDLVRDRLVAAGVEVRDAPEGTSWTLGSA